MKKIFLTVAFTGLSIVCSMAAAAKMPVFSGHRGDCEFGLQNTMSACKAAWNNGVKSIEIDVRTTADGKIICFHDADFIRIADDRRKVRNLTYAEILKIDIGSKKHPMFKDEKPPLLEDVFASMPQGSHIFVELKNDSVDENFPYVLRDLMKKYSIERYQVTVVSFSEDMLINLNKKVPGMSNMLIVGLRDCRRLGMKAPSSDPQLALNNILKRLKEIGCTGLSFAASDKRIKYDEKFFRAFIDAGYEISVWLVNDVWEAYNLAKMGARYVVTDRPSTMQSAWIKLFENK